MLAALNAMNRIYLIFIFGLFSQGVLSGGYHFEVLVESFDKNGENWDEYTLVLSPTSSEANWPEEKCESLTVVGEFDSLRWATYKRPMSKETHQRSISYLSESVGQRVLFGVMGSGLKENKPCIFFSKGLFIEPYGNKHVVLSVHGRI